MDEFILLDFDPGWVVSELLNIRACSFTIIEDGLRIQLLEEALKCSYLEREKVVGRAQIKQDLWACDEFPTDSPFKRFGNCFQEEVDEKLGPMERYVFSSPITINEIVLQKYEPGSIGITTHMDNLSSINLISIVILTGKSRFVICSDREGHDPVDIDATPGRVIMMRAPGFMDSNFRPFHYLTDIIDLRITLGLRQIKKPA